MKKTNTIISKHILYVLLLLTTLTISSCEDDNVGGFVLTGNIEHLIPEGSYELKKTTTNDGQYITYTPELNSNFEYWGLSFKKVEYYIDGIFYKMNVRKFPINRFYV